MTRESLRGFTLIELSIVLVIIGLIVGGVLAGQDLIKAAAVRAQITQIEKYNTAANTFYSKYGYLPGDIPAAPAAQFGLKARGTNPGQGDGNGIIQACGVCDYQTAAWGFLGNPGEPVLFWDDLSATSLIEGSFTTGDASTNTPITGSAAMALYFPQAKLGNGNFVYVYSPTFQFGYIPTNYFGISAVSGFGQEGLGELHSTPGMTVQQAAAIDSKVDDGLPQSGRVLAFYVNVQPYWTDGTSVFSAANTGTTPGSSTTCFDNSYAGGVAAAQHYSLAQNNGNGVNCALSFKMQAGD